MCVCGAISPGTISLQKLEGKTTGPLLADAFQMSPFFLSSNMDAWIGGGHRGRR